MTTTSHIIWWLHLLLDYLFDLYNNNNNLQHRILRGCTQEGVWNHGYGVILGWEQWCKAQRTCSGVKVTERTFASKLILLTNFGNLHVSKFPGKLSNLALLKGKILISFKKYSIEAQVSINTVYYFFITGNFIVHIVLITCL